MFVYDVINVFTSRKEEELKLELLNDNRPLNQRYYGDSKREATIKYKKGVAFAKFLSKKKSTASIQLFMVTLPDGSSCCLYPLKWFLLLLLLFISNYEVMHSSEAMVVKHHLQILNLIWCRHLISKYKWACHYLLPEFINW